MSIHIPRVEFKLLKIELVGTHNTISPFSSRIPRGLETELHTITIHGKTSGPKIYVGGGTHGDELNGVAAALKLAQLIKADEIKGSIIIVPIQNPGAFSFRERLSPYDPIDPDWVHPGNVSGTYTQRLKYSLNFLAKDADCVIDMHTSGRSGSNNPMIYVPPETGNGAGKLSLRLARSFGGDRIVFGKKEEDYDWPVKNAMPFIAVREGRAGIYAEAGRGGSSIPEDRYIEFFVTGVLNVMKSMGIIEGSIAVQGERFVIDPDWPEINISSPVEGILRPLVSIGERVDEGEIVAEIWSIPDRINRLVSPLEGLVTYLFQYGSIGVGETILTISPNKSK